MMAPLFKLGYFGSGFSLIIALIIGFFFGYFIERGGLGNAKKLAGQFYLTDFTVFKLMFSAVVTAMLGLFWISRLGLLDLSLVFVNPTYLYPQIVAGLLFGVGFVVGGLCPGTSCVALASGRLDGLALLIGIFTGIFLFGELFDSITGFFYSSSYGALTLPLLFGLQPGTIVLIVVAVALGGFILAEAYERHVSIKSLVSSWRLPGVNQRLAFIAIVPSLAAALVGSPVPNLERATVIEQIDGVEVDYITPMDLAQLLMEPGNKLQLMDGRTTEEFADYHLPFAQQFPPLRTSDADPLVVYYSNYQIPEADWLALSQPGASSPQVLLGGMERWRRDVLFPYLAGATDLSESELKRRARISRFFGGDPKLPLGIDRSSATYAREGC
ncbi:YeeE/YedE thiosulfate transporter family protein [Candidatus Neomarinimicrobiota bacterium]